MSDTDHETENSGHETPQPVQTPTIPVPIAIDITAGPETPNESSELTTLKVLPLIHDTHGQCVLDMSFRVIEHGPGRGKLDPINKGMTVALRIRRRMPDGTYRMVRRINVSHAEQYRMKQVQTPFGDQWVPAEQRPRRHLSRMHLKPARDPASNQIVEIIDPEDELFKVLSQLCDASPWPNAPAELTAEQVQEQTNLARPDFTGVDDIPYG